MKALLGEIIIFEFVPLVRFVASSTAQVGTVGDRPGSSVSCGAEKPAETAGFANGGRNCRSFADVGNCRAANVPIDGDRCSGNHAYTVATLAGFRA